MKIKIVDHTENTTRVFEYSFSLSMFVKIHYTSFGIFRVKKTGENTYSIYNDFNGRHVYTVSKAGARDALTE